MIIESIYDDYGRRAAERKFRGNPTGSQLGACTAALQFQRFPAQSRPEPLRARDLIRFEHGHIEEEWLNDVFKRSIPGLTGLRQEPFYFPVPLDAADLKALLGKVQDRAIWGTQRDGFKPPYARIENGRPMVVVEGKAIQEGQLLPTPTGYVKAGDVRVGDMLLAVDGTPTFPQPEQPLAARDVFRRYQPGDHGRASVVRDHCGSLGPSGAHLPHHDQRRDPGPAARGAPSLDCAQSMSLGTARRSPAPWSRSTASRTCRAASAWC